MIGYTIAEINYLTHTIDGKPPRLVSPSKIPWATTNFIQAPTLVTINDLRGQEKMMELDKNSFEVFKYDGCIQEEFDQSSEVQKIYYEEMSSFLKKCLGASRVLFYHYAFRNRGPPRTILQCDVNHRNPLFYPHVDIDSVKVRRLLEQRLGTEEATKVMQNRYQVLNIWRPIGGSYPITDKPLAFCDYQSIDLEKDVHPLILGETDDTPTSYTISRNAHDTHKWYYLSHMQSNEMFVFKTFDSAENVAKFAFHSAFINRDELTSDTDQKSIEIRCFVLYD